MRYVLDTGIASDLINRRFGVYEKFVTKDADFQGIDRLQIADWSKT